jgi:hypothetical protein
MTELKIKTKDKFNKTTAWIKDIAAWFDKHPVTFVICLSLFMTLVIEKLCRRSVVDGFVFMILNPLIFLANASILFFMYSLSLLLKKRYSIILVVTVIWFGLAVADFITTAYRVTPISFNDILILPSVFSIINIYLTIIELIAVGIAVVAAITAIVIAIIRQKKREVAYLKAGITSAVSALLTVAILISSMNSDKVAKGFSFIGNGYKQYGFVFSFCLSTLDRGIDKPENYGEEAMSEVEDDIGKIDTNKVTPDVNIIMLQLESFIDVNRLKNVTFSENPLPYFTYL